MESLLIKSRAALDSLAVGLEPIQDLLDGLKDLDEETFKDQDKLKDAHLPKQAKEEAIFKDQDEPFILQVGCQQFTTTLRTLKQSPWLKGEAQKQLQDGGGKVLIDRNPEHYAILLDWMRECALPWQDHQRVVQSVFSWISEVSAGPLERTPALRASRPLLQVAVSITTGDGVHFRKSWKEFGLALFCLQLMSRLLELDIDCTLHGTGVYGKLVPKIHQLLREAAFLGLNDFVNMCWPYVSAQYEGQKKAKYKDLIRPLMGFIQGSWPKVMAAVAFVYHLYNTHRDTVIAMVDFDSVGGAVVDSTVVVLDYVPRPARENLCVTFASCVFMILVVCWLVRLALRRASSS